MVAHVLHLFAGFRFRRIFQRGNEAVYFFGGAVSVKEFERFFRARINNSWLRVSSASQRRPSGMWGCVLDRFSQLVSGCIDADVGNQSVIFQHFSRSDSTRDPHFCTADDSKSLKKKPSTFADIFMKFSKKRNGKSDKRLRTFAIFSKLFPNLFSTSEF